MPPTTDLILGAVLLLLAAGAALGAYALRARNHAVEDYQLRRKLRMLWKSESREELEKAHGMESGAERLIRVMSEEIALEIDREILAELDPETNPKPLQETSKNLGEEKTTPGKKCMTCKELSCDCQLEMFDE